MKFLKNKLNNFIRVFVKKIRLELIMTIGLIAISFLLSAVGSGWGGDFKLFFLKISIHNLKNLEIAFWFLITIKVIALYYTQIEQNRGRYIGYKNKMNPFLNYLVYFLIITLLIILYRGSLGNYFLCDDYLILREVKKGFYNSVLAMPAFAQRFRFIRPMALFSWFLNYRIFSIQPFGWYLMNLALHAVSVAIVILLAKAISDSLIIAMSVGAFFTFAPIHHEVINWIAARADLLCGLFYLLSLYLHILFRKNNQRIIFLGSLLSFVLALLSKENAVSLPIIVICCELFLSQNVKSGMKKRLSLYLYYFLILGLYLLTRFFVYGSIGAGAELGGASKILMENIPEYIKGTFLGLFVPMFFPINWLSVKHFHLNWLHYLSFFNATTIFLLIIFNIKKILNNRVILFAILFIIFTSATLFNIWEIGNGLHGSRYYYFVSFGFYLFIAGLALIANKAAFQKKINILALAIAFFSNLIFLSVNNLAWSKAGKIPLQVASETKKLYPRFNKDDGRVIYYYGLPKDVAGIVVYSWESEVITEQLSHFYRDRLAKAMLVRPRGIMVDLHQVDLKKDIVLQWSPEEEKISDLTLALRDKLKGNIPASKESIHPLLQDIDLWKRSKQVTKLEDKGGFQISGYDGFFFSKEFSVPAKDLPFLVVRMKVIPQSKKYYAGGYSGRLYWRTDKLTEFNENRFIEFWLNPKEEYDTYYIYFISPEEILRDENIIQLKFMPTYFPSWTYIDYIKLVLEPDPKAKRPFFHKVN